MNKTKLLKSILIPTLGISAIGSIAAVCTSCGNVSVKSVSLNKTSTTLTVGNTETLTATVLPETATDKSVNWTSNNPSVVTADSNGKITAKAIGTATITVKTNDGGKTATCEVTVNPIHVKSVSLNKTSTTLTVGNTETLTASVLPKNATYQKLSWTSSNPSVATVNNGTITAVSEGTATITVKTHDGGKTDTCAVNVNNSPYVVITANEDSTLTFVHNYLGNIPDLQYSTDCTNWSAYSEPINITQGQSLYLKGNNPTGWSHSDGLYSTLSITGNVSIAGNVMGLLDNGAKSGEQGDITGIPCDYCFINLFQNSAAITSVSDSFLPATTLTNGCYAYMFQDCTSLTTAPEVLPTTTLADNCYRYMFQGCTSLTTAPTLPATNLITNCYFGMFYDCASLTTAPELPATILSEYCYYFIFKNCKSLNLIKISYTGNYDSTYFSDWVSGVASSGTFYYNGSQTAQDFELPSGWTKSPF